MTYRIQSITLGFILGILVLVVGTALLAQELMGDNCTMTEDGWQVCEFEAESSPACHNTEDFPSPQSVADFYGGKVLHAEPTQTSQGTLFTTVVEVEREDGTMRYVFRGLFQGDTFDNCMLVTAFKAKGEPT